MSVSRSVSVVICSYSLDRWKPLVEAVESVRAQSLSPDRIVLVVDHNPDLLARARASFSEGVTIVENTAAQGLSGARNTGVARAEGAVVAFLDDDAAADREWLHRLIERYDDGRVLGVGGLTEPWWIDGKPRWFPEEFQWVVVCSYLGLPMQTAPVRNLIGANMSFRRDVLDAVGGFRDELGRVGARPFGVEETELCIRASQRLSGIFVFEPGARARHRVPGARTTFRYFCSHTYNEGFGKAMLARIAGAADGLSAERAYTYRTVPMGIARGLADAARGDLSGLGRAGAIVAGLACAVAGYAAGWRARKAAVRASLDARPK